MLVHVKTYTVCLGYTYSFHRGVYLFTMDYIRLTVCLDYINSLYIGVYL